MNVTLDQLDNFILPEAAYYEQEDLEEAILPEGLRVIGPAAFAGCANLHYVSLPTSLAEISEGAFLGCTALKEIVFPPHLTVIGDMAFWGSGLEQVSIPESVSYIGETAFWDCANLQDIQIWNSDAFLGKNAFGECPRLISGYLAPGIPDSDWPPTQLLYVLLWCSCPDRHTAETGEMAAQWIREHERVVMDHIIRANNTPALTVLLSKNLLNPQNINCYLKETQGKTELTALLLASRTPSDILDDFAL